MLEDSLDPLGVDPRDVALADLYRGHVFDLDGKPIEGAAVYVTPQRSSNFWGTELGPLRATTNADGYFEFRAPDMTRRDLDGTVNRRSGLLLATKAGFSLDGTLTWGYWAYDNRRLNTFMPKQVGPYNLRLTKADIPVCGQLLDSDQKPLAGAKVRVGYVLVPEGRNLDNYLDPPGGPGMWAIRDAELYPQPFFPGMTCETQTDDDGRFRLNGYGRDWVLTLKIDAPTVQSDELTVAVRDMPSIERNADATWSLRDQMLFGASFTCRMKPGLTIHGVVRDRHTKQPLPNMWVTRWGSPIEYPSSNVTTTDHEGRFALAGLDPADAISSNTRGREVTTYPHPGTAYLPARASFDGHNDLVIETAPTIPVTIRIVDEDGRPVDGRLEAISFGENRALAESLGLANESLTAYAKRLVPGVYQTAAIPGPGYVGLIRETESPYRSAMVDANAFFNPGKSDWTEHDQTARYGRQGTLLLNNGGNWADKHNYAAIVLINPAANSPPLEFTATVYRDRPRTISLVDTEGKPVIGAELHRWHPWANHDHFPLRTAVFQLDDMQPHLSQPITVTHAEQKLIAYAQIRGDSDESVTLTMVPWAEIKGRIVNPDGSQLDYDKLRVVNDDPLGCQRAQSYAQQSDGVFRVFGMVPGQSYTSNGYIQNSWFRETAVFASLTLEPGEVRNVGEIRAKNRETTP